MATTFQQPAPGFEKKLEEICNLELNIVRNLAGMAQPPLYSSIMKGFGINNSPTV
jgi:hypothetical protein